MPGWSVCSRSRHVSPFSTLPPREVTVPAQLPPAVLSETIVLTRKTEPSPTKSPPPLLIPPPNAAEFAEMVAFRTVMRDETSRPPPNWLARFPETVELSTVASPSPSLNTPAPLSATFPDSVERFTTRVASPTWWIAPPMSARLPEIDVVVTTSGPSPRLSIPPPSPFDTLPRMREPSIAADSPSPTTLSPPYEIPPPPSSGESDTLSTTSIPTMRTAPDWMRTPPPASSAWFEAMRVPVISTCPPPSLLNPPPASARFSRKLPPAITTSPPEFECIPPPSPPTAVTESTAAFFVKAVLSTVTRPEPSLPNPPPFNPVFSTIVLDRIDTLPVFPLCSAPPQSAATFFVNEVSTMSRKPNPVLEIAPPLFPPFSTNVQRVTVTSPLTL